LLLKFEFQNILLVSSTFLYLD